MQIEAQRRSVGEFVRQSGDSTRKVWTVLVVLCCCLQWANSVQASCGDYVRVDSGRQFMRQNALPHLSGAEMARSIAEFRIANDSFIIANSLAHASVNQFQKESLGLEPSVWPNSPLNPKPCSGPECRRQRPMAPLIPVTIEPSVREWAALFCFEIPLTQSANWGSRESTLTIANGKNDRIERPPRLIAL